MTVAKPNGFEPMQIRFGGIRSRFLEAARRGKEFLSGEAENIPELEPEQPLLIPEGFSKYIHTATASIIDRV